VPERQACAGCGAGALSLIFQAQDRHAFRYLVAGLIFISLTTPAKGAGTSIVALSDSRVISESFRLDGIAGLDQHFDHRDVLEITDVGNEDVA